MPYQSFEDLEVWKRACRLATEIIILTQQCNIYALKDQMTRSSLSIPSNIAEGQERDAPKDFIRFLRIAKGSCGELRTQLYIASKTNTIPNETTATLINETKEIASMLQGLIRSIQTT